MRTEGWESRLNDYIAAARAAEFVWGRNDCALWAAGWVLECTGLDLVTAWKGKYKTETGARRLIAKRGYSGLEAIADDGLNPTPVPLARRGDMVQHPQGPLGLCNGRLSHFLTDGGVLEIETLACVRAWAVG